NVPLAGRTRVTEDVPLCLVEGLTLTTFNFYIHGLPAENLTGALLPTLPPGLSAVDGPLMLLSLDPTHEPLVSGVSGADGLVRFTNVPPTFFIMRQFSDYGAPVTEPAIHRDRELGEDASYLSFDGFVLPNPSPDRIKDHQATGTPCHETWPHQQSG